MTTAIEVQNENGMTISSIEAEIDRMNEEAINIINSEPKTGQPVLVKLSNLMQRTTGLMADKEALAKQQDALDKYAVHCATSNANLIHRKKLEAARDDIKNLLGQVNREIAKYVHNSHPSSAIRHALIKSGIPGEKIQEVERNAKGESANNGTENPSKQQLLQQWFECAINWRISIIWGREHIPP